MKVRVVAETCQGHALCSGIAPDVFHPRDDDGHAVVAQEVVPRGLEEAARRAALACPEGAIEIDECA